MKKELVYIPIGRLHPHKDNPRKDLGDLTELADSIKVNGILQNLTVVPDDPAALEGDYTVIIGHRRLAAATMAGLTEVPCAVVALDPAQQVKTMLMENMQRSDLTVYEQAQGFQMMLDLGGTISTVAAETGFSETTVRRRVKLLELDPKEFKKSQERGATLFDYMELDKVDDIDEKNKLLKVIGTGDFRAKLQKVLDAQKKAALMVTIEEFLSSFATKVESADSGYKEPYEYMSGYGFWQEKDLIVPGDADSREYVFTMNSWGASLYRKRNQDDFDKLANEEAVRQERVDRSKAREAAVWEVSNRCYKLRKDFVMGLSSASCKKLAKPALAAILVSLYDDLGCLYDKDMKALGIAANFDADEPLALETVADAISNTDQELVRLAYLLMESGGGYFQDWGEYPWLKNEELDSLYEFLERLGYEMSEEEKAFQDGSHEIFKLEDKE